MNALTLLRLLAGPARPFALGKLRERLRGNKRIVLPASDVDARILLEQSRMHAWCEGVTDEALTAWMAEHPTTDPLMWAVAMDVGIRLHALCMGYQFAPTAIAREAILVHARWVWEHLETSGGMATSHMLGGLLGLVAASSCVYHTWLNTTGRTAASMLQMEFAKQFTVDGMNFEASTAYHRHVADIMVWATASLLQAEHLRGVIDDDWWRRLDAAMKALHVLESAGMPVIGDNDDGMAVKLHSSYPGTPSTSHLWSTYYTKLSRSMPEPPTRPSHHAFADFGLDVWFRATYTLTARCGVVGQYGKGGHAHNDHNSITLNVKGQPVIVDSGSYTYTGDPARRNSDRSTRSHSTVVSAYEQRAWPSGLDGLFWLIALPPHPHVVERSDSGWHGVVVHQNKRGYAHHRHIAVDDTVIAVCDEFGKGRTAAHMILVLAPDVQVRVIDGGAELCGEFGTVLLGIPDSAIRIEACEVAPAYGITQTSKRLVVDLVQGKLAWTITLPE